MMQPFFILSMREDAVEFALPVEFLPDGIGLRLFNTLERGVDTGARTAADGSCELGLVLIALTDIGLVELVGPRWVLLAPVAKSVL